MKHSPSPVLWTSLVLSLGLLAGLCMPAPADEAQQARINAYVKAPPTIADTPLVFNVVSPTKMVNGVNTHTGWCPRISGRILGHSRGGDAVIVDLAQNGKVLLTVRVGLKGTDTWYEDWEIAGNEEKDIATATGDITATLKYYDDDSEKTTTQMVRTIKVFRVVKYDSGANQWGNYGVNYDNLSGFSYLVQRVQDPNTNAPETVWLYCWIQHPNGTIKDVTYRIEVDGQRIELPNGFDAYGNHTTVESLEQEERYFSVAKKDAVRNVYNTYLFAFRPYLYWGKKPENAMANQLWLIDHPGKWVVKIRSEGQTIRELRFTVNADGTIAPHPEQNPAKPGFLNLGPERIFAETYYPNPIAYDDRFDPEAIRKGAFFGRPWLSDEVLKGMLPALPPAKAGEAVFPLGKVPPSK